MNRQCPSCKELTIPHNDSAPDVYCMKCFLSSIIHNPAILNTIFAVFGQKISFSNNQVMFVGGYTREFLDEKKVEFRKKLDITGNYMVEHNGYYIGSNPAWDEYWNDPMPGGEGKFMLLMHFYIRKSSVLDPET